MCDDCECQWGNPDAFAIDRRMVDNDNKVRDAIQEEIDKLGWMQFIKTDL